MNERLGEIVCGICTSDPEKGSRAPVDGFEGVGIPSAPPYEALERETEEGEEERVGDTLGERRS